MLEDTLRIAHGMWAGERGSEARASRAASTRRTGCSTRPQSISRPRVPIMIGGGGEQKTLRLVAQYADACNVFGSPEKIARKYAILDEHCAAVGRDPREIERSTLQSVRPRPPTAVGAAETPAQVVDRFGELWRRRRPARDLQRPGRPRPGPHRALGARSSRRSTRS